MLVWKTVEIAGASKGTLRQTRACSYNHIQPSTSLVLEIWALVSEYLSESKVRRALAGCDQCTRTETKFSFVYASMQTRLAMNQRGKTL